MAISPRRLRRATTCALIVALAAAFTLAPVGAQRSDDGWQVVESVTIDTDGWQVVESVTIDTDGFAPALSPDGLWVAGLKDLDERQLCVWRVSTGDERCNEESRRVSDTSIAWSPDSRQIAFTQNGAELDSDLFLLDVRSNSLTNLTEDGVDDLKAAGTAGAFVIYDQWPTWSPDGAELVFLRIQNPRAEQRQLSIARVILETGQVVRGQELVTDEPLEFVAETVGVVTPMQWVGRDSVVFAIRGGSDIAGIYLAEIGAGPPVLVESDPSIPVANTPLITGAADDGERLALYWLWDDMAIDGEFATWGLLDLDTGTIAPVAVEPPEGTVVAAPPRIAADGTALVYGVSSDEQTFSDSTVIVQDLATGETVEIMDGGVSLQLWESVRGIALISTGQLVLPMDDGSFEVMTLERV